MVSRKRKKKNDVEDIPARGDRAEPLDADMEEPVAPPEGKEALTESPEPSAAEAEVESAEQAVERLRAELADLEDRYLRTVAEFDNFRKRTIRERAQLKALAQAETVRPLLESLDDLARVSEWSSTDHDAASILEGIHLVERKLLRALEQVGLKPIEAVGEPFNPELHDAMLSVPTDRPDEDEIVSQELAKGYLFNEILLRPALVGVKQYSPAEDGEPEEAGPDNE